MATKTALLDKAELPKNDGDLVKINFCIPPLGTKIVLAEPWSFDLYYENRNDKLIQTLNLRSYVQGPVEKRQGYRSVIDPNYVPTYNSGYGSFPRYIQELYQYDYTPTNTIWEGGVEPKYGEVIKRVTLPRGAKLSVQRIYIRCGGAGIRSYNSVTFTLIKAKKKRGDPDPPHGRFWAKLRDVNQIVCYPIGSDPDVNEVWKQPEATHLRTFKFLDINDSLET